MSWNHRLASRLRFARYREEQKADPGTPGGRGDRPSTTVHRPLIQLYRDLYRILEGHRASIAASLAALSVASLLKLIPPAATKIVIDYVLLHRPLPPSVPDWLPVPESPQGRLIALTAVVLLVTTLGTAIGLWSRWRATLATKRVQVSVRRRVFEHAARLPLHRIYQLKAGGASSLLRDDAGSVGELIFSMLYNPWRAVVQFAGGLVVLAWADWRLLLASLALAPGLYLLNRSWNTWLRPLHREARRQRQEIDAKSAEAFGGMRVVRAFGRQRRESARFVGENHFLTRQELYTWGWARIIEVAWDLILPAASAGLLLYGGLQVIDGQLSPGDLMMFLVYLAMLLEPLAVLSTSVTQLQNNLAGFDRVLDLLAEPREMAAHPGTLSVSKRGAEGRISIDRVDFAYPETDLPVLRDIRLDVEPGETIALVGPSGAGKTTLCNLIARFYDPTAGAVRLDGIDLRQIQVESYRRLLGIVEQDVFLFDGTVGENIAYADRRASRSAIERAAFAAHADEFIAGLPQGYDTIIGERGVRLSGGQRQRLAIARAVLADPVLFILDEATSNLDSRSEQMIQLALADLMRGRTSFVIAHRLSTIRGADRIVVLDAGRIVEVGPHDELMARSGLYRDMVELQRLEGDPHEV